MNEKYYIWSWEHNSWWAPNERGYVSKKSIAGVYSYKDALRICLGANISFYAHGAEMPNEAMVPIIQKVACSCPYMPHSDIRCNHCGHFLAHHFEDRKCNTFESWCKECEEDQAKHG